MNLYARNGHPNQRYLEAKLANLENTEDAVALASGVAALAATFTTVLNRGDHAIFFDTTYIAAYRLLNQILPEWTIRSIRRSTHGSSTAARSRCRCA